MNTPTEQQIENLLRLAPQPASPGGLKEKLLMQTQTSSEYRSSQTFVTTQFPGGWLRRWWPVLAPAGFSVVCAVVFAVQQVEIRDLKQNIQTLSERAAAANSISSTPTARANAMAANASAIEEQEIARLKDQVGQLTAEISRLEQMRTENQNLRAQLSAPPAGLTPEETAAMEKARASAERIACVNNMKQMGLSVRIWAGDNNDIFPPDIVCMSNELNTPKILVCPADRGRQVANGFSSYTDANCSYEFLAPRGSDTEPQRVLFRCPIHQNIGLCDGSVQQINPDHPEWVVQRNGKFYLEGPFQR